MFLGPESRSAAVGKGEKCVAGKTCQLQQILERSEWVAGEFPTRGLSLGLSLGPRGTWLPKGPGCSGEPCGQGSIQLSSQCGTDLWTLTETNTVNTTCRQHQTQTEDRHRPVGHKYGNRKPKPPTLIGQAYLPPPLTPSKDSSEGHSGLYGHFLIPKEQTPH